MMSDQPPRRWNEPGVSPWDLPAGTGRPNPPPPVQAVVPAAGPEQIIFQVGDIGVSPSWIVTPNGSAPLAGSQWIGRDMSRTEKKTPTWAVVIAIIGFWLCLIPSCS